jgi:hypothetical protein
MRACHAQPFHALQAAHPRNTNSLTAVSGVASLQGGMRPSSTLVDTPRRMPMVTKCVSLSQGKIAGLYDFEETIGKVTSAISRHCLKMISLINSN